MSINNKFNNWYVDVMIFNKSFDPETYWIEIDKYNNNYKQVFVAIEGLSRFVYVEPIKGKEALINAVKKFVEKFKPNSISGDNAFDVKNIKQFLNNHKPPIKLYTSQAFVRTKEPKYKLNEETGDLEPVYKKNTKGEKVLDYVNENTYLKQDNFKLSIIDRVIRTLRDMITNKIKYGEYKWIDKINDVVEEYNNKKHSALYGLKSNGEKLIKSYYTPKEVYFNKDLQSEIYFNKLMNKNRKIIKFNNKRNNLNINDLVRVKIMLPDFYKHSLKSKLVYIIIDKYPDSNYYKLISIQKPYNILNKVYIKHIKKLDNPEEYEDIKNEFLENYKNHKEDFKHYQRNYPKEDTKRGRKKKETK